MEHSSLLSGGIRRLNCTVPIRIGSERSSMVSPSIPIGSSSSSNHQPMASASFHSRLNYVGEQASSTSSSSSSSSSIESNALDQLPSSPPPIILNSRQPLVKSEEMTSGGGGDSRKRKHKRWNPVKTRTVEPGLCGLFMTIDGQDFPAAKEAFSIIEQLLDLPASAVKAEKKDNVVSADDDDDEDIADSLKRVCKETKEGGERHRWRVKQTGVKHCIFITSSTNDIGLNYVDLAEKMVRFAQESPRCRYLQRVLPVEETAAVDLAKLNDMIIKCVSTHMVKREDGTFPSYAMEFKARNNGSVNKDSVLDMLNFAINAVAPSAKVDLNGAEVLFFVQIVHKTMMIGAVRNYYGLRKYSMRPKPQPGCNGNFMEILAEAEREAKLCEEKKKQEEVAQTETKIPTNEAEEVKEIKEPRVYRWASSRLAGRPRSPSPPPPIPPRRSQSISVPQHFVLNDARRAEFVTVHSVGVVVRPLLIQMDVDEPYSPSQPIKDEDTSFTSCSDSTTIGLNMNGMDNSFEVHPSICAQRFTDRGQSANIMDQLDRFRHEDHLCDVELEVENRTLRAHRFVLAAASPYFRAMFGNNMKESRMDKIVINDINFDSLNQLINFIYTSEISIDSENVQNLLFTASILHMDTVSAACQRFLTQFITASNCLSMRNFAEMHNCLHLLDSTVHFAVDHFAELRLLPDFLQITFSHLRDLIKRSDLKVNREEEVFETVIEWVEYDINNRLEDLADLVELIRMPQLNMKYLCETVKKHHLIKGNRQCVDLVSDALFEMLSPLKGSTHPVSTAFFEEGGSQYAAGTSFSIPTPITTEQLSRCRPRKSVAGVIFCAGGRGTSGDPFRSVEAYDWRKNRWVTVAEMNQQRRHVGAVSAMGKLYAIGGHDGVSHLSTAEVLDPEAGGGWQRVAPMRTSRRGIAAAALDSAIYAVGGLDDTTCFNTVERYDIESDTWSSVASMMIQRGGVGVAALGKFLYAVGGNDGTSSLESCERYDPLLDKWKLINRMANRRAGAGVCVLDGCLYALGGFDDNAPLSTCERYDPYTDTWIQLASMNCPRGGVGVASMGGLVYAIGGHDGRVYLNTVEAYDPATNVWTPVANIRECRAGAGVAWAECKVDSLQPHQDSGCAPRTTSSRRVRIPQLV